jgi:hypothetical protein
MHYHWTTGGFEAPRVWRIARRRPVLTVTTLAALAVIAGFVWAWMVFGILVRVFAGFVLLGFAVDGIWLVDEWRNEWKRENWRRWCGRRR